VTNNTNWKKDAWASVVSNINAESDLQQLQNQKGSICKIYQDFKLLRDQVGFGWDEDQATPTADAKTCYELFSAHPRWHFDKIKVKLFPLHDLAKEVFLGAVATRVVRPIKPIEHKKYIVKYD
jgi:hypothetical protein